MAFIGSESPTAPSAVAPISRRRCNSVVKVGLRVSNAFVARSGAGQYVEFDGEGAAECVEVVDEMGCGRGWHEHPELGRTAGHPIADRVEQLLAAESVVRHHEVLMHNWDSSAGRRGFDGAVSRRPGKDEVSEERAGDAGDHDPDHGYGGSGAAGAGERG
jgi:hypothetical protein